MKPVLPQNYRKITAGFKKHTSKHAEKYMALALVLELILFLTLASFCAYLFLTYKKMQADRVEELKRLTFWEKQSVKFLNYPEAFYNAALHAVMLGDNEKAREYIGKSLGVNPDFEPSKKLMNEFGRSP